MGAKSTKGGEPNAPVIRQRAHELYQERGREEGHELDDWLRAQQEIKRKKVGAVSAS